MIRHVVHFMTHGWMCVGRICILLQLGLCTVRERSKTPLVLQTSALLQTLAQSSPEVKEDDSCAQLLDLPDHMQPLLSRSARNHLFTEEAVRPHFKNAIPSTVIA